ncbi:invasion associated locus B family protein [Henriciella sp.]|uniref:invasion associated locus B family protein n=1 Tax=Henriciella sp. TaxID=1968823 RepID=UPI0026269322|nr:invasion associated locus B family protein [Henriciella sp.]
MIRQTITISAALVAAATMTAEAAPTAVGRYDDWTVFTETLNGETLCYAATEATDKAPKAASHGDVWFFVSNWKSGKAKSQPSLKVGYDLRSDLPARASIGRSGWTMYGVGHEAFAQDQDDQQLVSALRSGHELRVEAVSARDTQVSYHFSLSGSADAIDKASSICR